MKYSIKASWNNSLPNRIGYSFCNKRINDNSYIWYNYIKIPFSIKEIYLILEEVKIIYPQYTYKVVLYEI